MIYFFLVTKRLHVNNLSTMCQMSRMGIFFSSLTTMPHCVTSVINVITAPSMLSLQSGLTSQHGDNSTSLQAAT